MTMKLARKERQTALRQGMAQLVSKETRDWNKKQRLKDLRIAPGNGQSSQFQKQREEEVQEGKEAVNSTMHWGGYTMTQNQ